jgi:hypothetical protein
MSAQIRSCNYAPKAFFISTIFYICNSTYYWSASAIGRIGIDLLDDFCRCIARMTVHKRASRSADHKVLDIKAQSIAELLDTKGNVTSVIEPTSLGFWQTQMLY